MEVSIKKKQPAIGVPPFSELETSPWLPPTGPQRSLCFFLTSEGLEGSGASAGKAWENPWEDGENLWESPTRENMRIEWDL